jgi:dTDP-4-dehydrorhamnose reductase
MKKILITGHTGFVGQSLCTYLLNQNKAIVGLSRNNGGQEVIKFLPCDLAETDSFQFLDDENLAGIIHLAANGNVGDCEQHPEESQKLNVRATQLLGAYAKGRDIPIVFASSDQVFDGEKGNYSIGDKALPLNAYGRQKLAAEESLLGTYSKAVVCRLPLMIGEHSKYIKAFISSLKAGKEQMLFTDEIRSVLHVDEAAKQLFKALTWDGGVYHLPGPKAINRYELGLQIAIENHLDLSLLKKGLQSDVQMLAKRPKNVSMVRT